MSLAVNPAALRRIADIELAMLAQLRGMAESGALGFTWRTLETFPDDFEAHLESNVLVQCPAAWVVFAGWQRTELTGDNYLLVHGASFGLVVADENKRSDEFHRRHGGPDASIEPGSYRLMMGAALSLAGQRLELLDSAIVPGPLRPVRPTVASGKRNLSLYACELGCDFSVALPTDEGGDLLAMHANYDVPLFGNPRPVDADPVTPGPQLPDDFHADMTAHQNLESEPDE